MGISGEKTKRVNIMNNYPDSLTKTKLKKEINYDLVSGVFTRLCGSVAGGFSHSLGYGRINILGNSYYSHRLAFLWVDGFMPKFVDHINGDVTDNSWKNLRRCTSAENNRNTRISKNNTSGFKGVSWCGAMNKWRARIYIDGKESILGYFDDINLANEKVTKERDKHYKEFNCNDR